MTAHSVEACSKITTEDGDVLVDLAIRSLRGAALAVDPENVHLVNSDERYRVGYRASPFVATFPANRPTARAGAAGLQLHIASRRSSTGGGRALPIPPPAPIPPAGVSTR